MPIVARLFLRSAIVHLLLAALVGGFIELAKMGAIDGGDAVLAWSLLPLHVTWMLGGFLLQFVIGTATWIMPRKVMAPALQRVGFVAFGLVSAGLIARTVHAVLLVLGETTSADRALSAISAAALVVGAVAAFVFLKPRIDHIPAILRGGHDHHHEHNHEPRPDPAATRDGSR